MDAQVYDSEHGGGAIYQMLANSALHLWIAFDEDGNSVVNLFDEQPGPDYDPANDAAGYLDRREKWDVDSEMPEDLAEFISEALREVYSPEVAAGPNGQASDHPKIINDYDPESDGFSTAGNLTMTYWWLYRFVKSQTTDYYKFLPPAPPQYYEFAPMPTPPPDPSLSSPDADPLSFGKALLENSYMIMLAVVARLKYLKQLCEWHKAQVDAAIASPATFIPRYAEYAAIDLPLYNALLSVHWYLAMTAFNAPLQPEINLGLTTLGWG